MAELREELADLKQRLTALESQTPSAPERIFTPDVPNDLQRDEWLQAVIDRQSDPQARNDYVLALEQIAEFGTRSVVLASKLAVSGTGVADSAIRAAAWRALAVVDPEYVSSNLPSLIDAETNKATKASMQSALRTAALVQC